MKAAVLALLLVAAPASADEGRFTLGLRVGALARGGDGYASHADAFGFRAAGIGVALGLSAGYHVTPRLRILASAGLALSASMRRIEPEETLTIRSAAYLVQVGYTPWRHEFEMKNTTWFVLVEGFAGAGLYTIRDELGSRSHSDVGPGGTAGARLAIGSGIWSFAVRYGYHLTAAHIEDRLGGELSAGGHDIGIEMGVRF